MSFKERDEIFFSKVDFCIGNLTILQSESYIHFFAAKNATNIVAKFVAKIHSFLELKT